MAINYLDENGLQILLTNLIKELDKRYNVNSGISIVKQSTAPAGNANILWLNTTDEVLYMYKNSNWVPLGAAYK